MQQPELKIFSFFFIICPHLRSVVEDGFLNYDFLLKQFLKAIEQHYSLLEFVQKQYF